MNDRPTSSAESSAPDPVRRRILVVEDDPRTVDLIRYRLLHAGYEVQIAFDGVSALERVRAERPDLVVTDMLLPRKDGFEVCDEIKSDPDLADLPVVMMSAVYRDEDDRLRARLHRRRAAPDVVLEKPLRFEELLYHLRHLIGDVARETTSGSETETILVVDDDPRGRRMVALALNSRGYRILEAEDAEKALSILDRESIAVVLTDVQMPGMSGLELLRELRRRSRELTVVMMTAYGSEAVAVEAMKLGANDYLTKPIDTRELMVVVRENVEKQRLARERARLVAQLKETSHDLVNRIDTLERQNQLLESSRRALQQAGEAQVEFVSTISHELRTPLTVIKGALAMVVDAGDRLGDQQRRDLLTRARTQTDRLIHLTNEFLDLERIESGRLSFAPGRIDLKELGSETCEALRPAAAEKDMSIEWTGPPTEAIASADREALLRILNNLISNAVKYSPPETQIDVELRVHEGAWRLEVRDRGPGVPDDLKTRIFDRFVRAESSAADAGSSTGLGLSIVRSLVRLHDGDLGVEDHPEGGAIFWFSLPQKGETPAVRRPGTVVCLGLDKDSVIELAALLSEHGVELAWFDEPTRFLSTHREQADRFVLDLQSPSTAQSLFLILKWIEDHGELPTFLIPADDDLGDREPERLFPFVERLESRPNTSALAETLISS